jgi:hypothetical protein
MSSTKTTKKAHRMIDVLYLFTWSLRIKAAKLE